MKITHTGTMIRAALNSSLAQMPRMQDQVSGAHAPVACPEMPEEILNPRDTYKDKGTYNTSARELAE